MEFVEKHIGTYKPLLAGNSVYVDFSFLKVSLYHVLYFFFLLNVVVDCSYTKIKGSLTVVLTDESLRNLKWFIWDKVYIMYSKK